MITVCVGAILISQGHFFTGLWVIFLGVSE